LASSSLFAPNNGSKSFQSLGEWTFLAKRLGFVILPALGKVLLLNNRV
jgi:hypothetical protein